MIQIFKNFLTHEHAWNLACSIDGTPSNWWAHVIRHKALEGPLYTQSNVGGYRQRFENDFHLRKSVEKGSFTYRFHRTTTHKENCPCWECTFKKDVLESENFKQFITQQTSLKNPILHESFTSAYYPGDFLGQHTDEKRGVAFIFNLSWKWKPEYGGLLHVENDIGFQCYVPGWGDLVLLELGETGENHFVSEVSHLAPRPRIAISGWYNESD